MSDTGVEWIVDPGRIRLLENSVRQEILDAIEAAGPLTVRDLALELGRPADGLYYHVNLLRDAGLLREVGTRATARRDARLYDLCAGALRVRYPLDDPEGMEAVRRMAAAMLRVAGRDFDEGTRLPGATVDRDRRNLWVGRVRGWLDPGEIRTVNDHLNALLELFERATRRKGTRLVSLVWVLAPQRHRPARR